MLVSLWKASVFLFVIPDIAIVSLHRFVVGKCWARFLVWCRFFWPTEAASLPRAWWPRHQHLSYVRNWNFEETSNNIFRHKYVLSQRIWSYQSDLWWTNKPLCPYHVHASLAKWTVSIQRIQCHSRRSWIYRKVCSWVCHWFAHLNAVDTRLSTRKRTSLSCRTDDTSADCWSKYWESVNASVHGTHWIYYCCTLEISQLVCHYLHVHSCWLRINVLQCWVGADTMMTSINWNIFRVTGPLWGEFTGHRWNPLTEASDAQLWGFLWHATE